MNTARSIRWMVAGGALLVALGCAPAASAADPELGDEFTLGVGEVATLDMDRVAVLFRDVPEDSRCPADVQCYWEGDATVVVEVTVRDETGSHELHTNRRFATEVRTQGYRIALRSVRPEKFGERTIPRPEYRANLVVTRE